MARSGQSSKLATASRFMITPLGRARGEQPRRAVLRDAQPLQPRCRKLGCVSGIQLAALLDRQARVTQCALESAQARRTVEVNPVAQDGRVSFGDRDDDANLSATSKRTCDRQSESALAFNDSTQQ